MIAYSPDERLAVLLTVLGDDVASNAIKSMNSSGSLNKLYQEFKTDPPSSEEIEYVVGDFLKYFEFAIETLGKVKAETEAKAEAKAASEVVEEQIEDIPDAPPAKKQDTEFFPRVQPSNDPVSDLNRLDPYQIVKAIGDDHPKTIAMVLRKIDVSRAAKVLELIKAETRGQVVAFLTLESTVPPQIVDRVLRSTVQKAVAVTFRPPEVDQSQILAELMRSLPKNLRSDLMKQLAEADADLAAKVKAKLYVLEDVLRLEDRDIQKLLGQIESDSLIVGLQGTEQQLTDKLLNNLSKRARESIIEEMEFKKSASEVEIKEGRKKIVDALATLDEAGEIKL